MKLTKAKLASLALPPGKAEALWFDDDLPGFGFRLRAGGSAGWVVQYRIGIKQRRMSFGTLAALDPDKARAKARELLARVRLGEDPQGQKLAARSRAAIPPFTVADLAERYLAGHAATNLRPRSRAEVERHLRVHWRPLHGRPVAGLTRADVAGRLGELAASSGPVSANRARAALSALFTWAMRQGLVEGNPVVGTAKPAEERARERVLQPEEIAAVWRTTEGPGDYNAIVRLLLLTGQRREEVAGMRWEELDLGKALWSLPGSRTKNGLPHDVPLSDPAVAVLRSRTRRDGRDLVFGEGDGPFSGWSQSKRRLDGRLDRARRRPAAATGTDPARVKAMPPWVLHDLRRSLVTGMAEIGVQPHVIEAVVNHVSGHKGGVAGVYNRATYAAEKRQALHRWAEHVLALVAGPENRSASLPDGTE